MNRPSVTINSGKVSSFRTGRTSVFSTPNTSATPSRRRQSPVNEMPGTTRVAAQSAAVLISRRQRSCMLGTRLPCSLNVHLDRALDGMPLSVGDRGFSGAFLSSRV